MRDRADSSSTCRWLTPVRMRLIGIERVSALCLRPRGRLRLVTRCRFAASSVLVVLGPQPAPWANGAAAAVDAERERRRMLAREAERRRWWAERLPETIERRVLAFVREYPEGVSSEAIRASVRGGSQAIDAARRRLVDAGGIRLIRCQGGGRYVPDSYR
jgi:hypothetical protein